MLKRTLTGLVLCLIFAPIVIFSDTVALTIAASLISLVSSFEMFRCIGIHKKYVFCVPFYLCAAGAPFIFRYLSGSGKLFSYPVLIAFALIIWTFGYVVFMRGKFASKDASLALAMNIYISFALGAFCVIRDVNSAGLYSFLLIPISACITDIFAYLCGRAFGKHKLIPEISPKKTVEGSIGGTFFCVIVCLLYGVLVNRFADVEVNFVWLGVGALVLALVSQIGDLIMSAVKREYGIKDYGKIFPGHGGMLDRFDSMLAVSLAMAAICTFTKLFY